jgi:hypothetical protein
MPANATARRKRGILPAWLGLSLATALGALLLAAWGSARVGIERASPTVMARVGLPIAPSARPATQAMRLPTTTRRAFPATTATPTTAPARTATLEAPPPAAADELELTGPVLVDSQAGRLYASGRVGQVRKTLVMAASDGRLLATYGITGSLALDSVHGWLYVDRGDQGLAVLDAGTGALRASIPLTDSQVVAGVYRLPGPAPQADPASGQVLAFRDNLVYVADAEQGVVTRVIPFDVPKGNDCRMAGGPLPIKWATYDSARRILYLDFETYVCTPWISDTLLSYDMASGAEIARRAVPAQFSATAFDGYLYDPGLSRRIGATGRPALW